MGKSGYPIRFKTTIEITKKSRLVVEPYPSEKYASVNWDDAIPNGKMKFMFQSTNQSPFHNQDVRSPAIRIWTCSSGHHDAARAAGDDRIHGTA